MSDDPSEPPKIPRVLREKETFAYSVLSPRPRAGEPNDPEVWLFGAQRNVIPGGEVDEEDADGLPYWREIELGSGGSVKLTITADLFKLTPADREFVFDMIDRFKKYENGDA